MSHFGSSHFGATHFASAHLRSRRDGYLVFTRPTPNGSDTLVTFVPSSLLTYTLTGLVANSEAYVYVDAISSCGVRSTVSASSRLRRVAMDADNQLIPPAPNAPHGLKLTLGVNGLVTASWQHSDINSEADAAGFNVYLATGATPFDFDTVNHSIDLPSKSVSLGTFADATTVRVIVRARTAGGIEETNTNETTATADALAPVAPASIIQV